MEKDIYYMIGIPGSGKSHAAQMKAAELGIPVLSSDKMRKELTGDAGDVETHTHKEIFERLRSEADARIEEEKGFVWDATGIDAKFRWEDIGRFRRKGARVIGLLMVTPKEICLERNRVRERTVPEDVIENMDEQSRSAEHAINTELDLFDEVSLIDESGDEVKVYEREAGRGEGTISREAKIIPGFKMK